MKLLDLFCGAGGLAAGFKQAGFEITGVDNSESAGQTFEANSYGKFFNVDLSKQIVRGDYEVVIGGPPCKPWSSVNITKRDRLHNDYHLLARFFRHIELNEPQVFLMENVPPVANTEIFTKLTRRLSTRFGYSIQSSIVAYSDYGAPTKRHRLIVFGDREHEAAAFFKNLSTHMHEAATVRDVIWNLRKKAKGEAPDHIWPDLKTISKYLPYYASGKFGWYILKWDAPAPSFGNIMKTYILHPDAFDGIPARVISIREALLIMGFPERFRFPDGLGLGERYQLVADSVSPVFSSQAARVLKKIVTS
jgi:DNA (cytosine-5)-methyltransferase 1